MEDHPNAPPAGADDTTVQRARRMPKVLLHDHLDGGLRIPTLIELARQRGLALPADDAETLSAWFDARAHAGSLVEYLRGFALTVAAMASPQALERVAFEAAEDARADGCVLAEFRIAPLLFEAHGVAGEAAVEALLAGLRRSALPSGLIVCAMRQLDDAEIARAAQLALRYRGQGVVGFDLAGPEAGHPATRHAALLARVREEGLPLTLHAGEADEGRRVVEAVRLGARRIGHGVRLADLIGTPEGQPLVDEVKAASAHLEVCPTSNVHTGAAASIARHPIRALWAAGLSLSFHTDNPLISCLRQSDEAVRLVREAGFGWGDLVRMGLAAAEASFLPAPQRLQAAQALRAWAVAEGLG
ncbi:adenosine deaminase [Aquabacterium sp.]|uniref:adenosine deaminase family protein n=1 Tax=Aquabacterium sp. TaxID=1872578 RepID=UPI0037832909